MAQISQPWPGIAVGDASRARYDADEWTEMFQDMFNYIPAEIVGFVYGSALDSGAIREQDDVMLKASELGSKLVSDV